MTKAMKTLLRNLLGYAAGNMGIRAQAQLYVQGGSPEHKAALELEAIGVISLTRDTEINGRLIVRRIVEAVAA